MCRKDVARKVLSLSSELQGFRACIAPLRTKTYMNRLWFDAASEARFIEVFVKQTTCMRENHIGASRLATWSAHRASAMERRRSGGFARLGIVASKSWGSRECDCDPDEICERERAEGDEHGGITEARADRSAQ